MSVERKATNRQRGAEQVETRIIRTSTYRIDTKNHYRKYTQIITPTTTHKKTTGGVGRGGKKSRGWVLA